MIPLRKQFEFQWTFPFHIDYKQTKSLKHELPEHTHEWLEIVIIHEGKGSFFIDQTFHDLQEHDIIIIPSNTIHRAIPDNNNSLTSTAIFFSPALLNHSTYGNNFIYLKLFEESKARKNYRYSLDPSHLIQLNDYIYTLMKEAQTDTPDQVNAILLWLHVTLLHLSRNCFTLTKEVTKQTSIGPEWFTKSLLYIDKHLGDNINLNQLSKQAAVSPAHFSRVFKQLVGMNVTDYIVVKRILLAKDLLLNFNDKLSTIANQCGFNSMPHFFRTFKKQTSMTPSEYRKKY